MKKSLMLTLAAASLSFGCGYHVANRTDALPKSIHTIAVPALDATGTPASLSEPICTGLLRDTMKFRGVVVTDDLEMKALPQADPGAQFSNAETVAGEPGSRRR